MKRNENGITERSTMRIGLIRAIGTSLLTMLLFGVTFSNILGDIVLSKESDEQIADSEVIDISNFEVRDEVEVHKAIMLSTADLELKEEVAEPERTITFPSIEYMTPSGRMFVSDELTINLDKLKEAYEAEIDLEWDNKEYINNAAVIYEFLVEQNGVSPEIASAIIGNCAYEGGFGMTADNYYVPTSLEETYNYTYNSGYSIGICQWCYGTRKKALYEFYKAANDLGLEDYQEVTMVAELSFMYAELHYYDLFEDLEEYEGNVATACGNVALNYEAYNGVEKDFSSIDFSLKRTGCNGYCRLTYAQNTYEYFTTQHNSTET